MEEVHERISKYKNSSSAYDRLREIGIDLRPSDKCKNFKDDVVKATKWLLKESMPGNSELQYKGHRLGEFRDFNDDLWYSAIFANKLKWPKYDVVLADEVQDFNDNQKIALSKLAEAGAKIIAVGDPNQAIYRFRGADSNAFESLGKMLNKMSGRDVIQSLSSNFRSKQAIIDYSNKFTCVNNLQAGLKSDEQGTVTDWELTSDNALDSLYEENKQGKLKETAFISRTNAPLAKTALKLLADGIHFVIMGKDLAKDLINFVKKISAMKRLNDNDDVLYLQDNVLEYLNDEIEEHGTKIAKRGYLKDVTDTGYAINTCIINFSNIEKDGNIRQFKKWLEEKLSGLDIENNVRDLKAYEKSKKENPVVLTTAHRSKGLEFDRVYILEPGDFPHPKSKREEDLVQERNMKYVAYTRAKNELHILKPTKYDELSENYNEWLVLSGITQT